jgi:hypothetical protein
MKYPAEVDYFADAAALRRRFERHARSRTEIWLSYYKAGTGRPSVK